MIRQGVITYEGLPISGGGAHKVRTKGFVQAWARIEHFLKECTAFERPDEVLVELLEGGGLPASFVEPLKQRFLLEFPVVRSRARGEAIGHQFSVDRERFPALLQELESVQQPPPHFGLWPLKVHVTVKVRFVDPTTRKILSFQDPADYLNQDARIAGHRLLLGSSVLYPILSARSTAFVFFSLPFVEADSEFRHYVAFLSKHVPFTFSRRHWKVWTLNKRRERYVGRTMPYTADPP